MELNDQAPPVANLAMGEDFRLDDRTAPNGDAIEIAAHTSIHDFRTKRWPKNAKTFQFIMLSAIYAKLLVVVCLSIVSAEVVTHQVPLYYYEGFFTYLYGISILFLLYAYTFLLRSTSRRNSLSRKEPLLQGSPLKGDAKDDLEGANQLSARKKRRILETRPQHGSIFLRIGAIAFGLGAMIYIGLELGSFFEIPSTSPCYDLMRGLNPILQVVFTFAQMYFIFMNSRLNIHKFKACARFGLMHVVATNICVWIRTVVRESMKDMVAYGEGDMSEWHEDATMLRHIGNLTGNVTSCQRQDIMGTIVADSAPYLYPFIYQYCLIAAAVIYVMWRNIGRTRAAAETEMSCDSPSPEKQEMMAAGNSSKVDCVGSSKGLFFGLFVLVAATISLILFFVLVGHERFKRLSLFFADVSECAVMTLSLLAMMLGFARVQALRFCSDRDDVLSDLLLRVATFGVYLYSMFGLIAGAMSALSSEPNLLVMVTCALTILQVTIQTLFVSDVSHRASYLVDHERTKPGRQVVTFLLICNLTLWIIETFEMQRVQVNPVQLDFYGNLAWASIQRISLPLTIFYRFHSSVMLAEVWKNAYRIHPN